MELRPLIHVISVHLDRCQEYAYIIGELVITGERKGCHETRAEPEPCRIALVPLGLAGGNTVRCQAR
jgi:hypothetical protein